MAALLVGLITASVNHHFVSAFLELSTSWKAVALTADTVMFMFFICFFVLPATGISSHACITLIIPTPQSFIKYESE